MATDAEPLVLSADEVAAAPSEVRAYLKKLQRRQLEACKTKSVQLVRMPIVEVGHALLPSVDSTETRLEALVAELVLVVQSGRVDREKVMERLAKEGFASLAARSAGSRAQNGSPTPAPTSAHIPAEAKQPLPTSGIEQQAGTPGDAPNGIAMEPAANQSDVGMFVGDQIDTPRALPDLQPDNGAVLSAASPISARHADHALDSAVAASGSVASRPADTDGTSSVAASSSISSVADPSDVQRDPEDDITENPSIEDWSNFGTLYERLRDSREQHGFALITVPGRPSYAATVRPQISESSCQSFRQKSATAIELDHTITKHSPYTTWQIESNPTGARDARTAFDEWWTTFGYGVDYLPPQYATDIDVSVDPLGRQRCCLLESPIYPLDGNVLLDSAPDTRGLTRPECYISLDYGTIFSLHTEDFDAPAINFLHYGHPKLWVVIPQSEREKLKHALARKRLAHQKAKSCHQYIRHRRLFLHLTFLEESDIQYTCFLQEPGKVVLLFPGATHFGFNLGRNAAEAVNYVPRGWEPPDSAECRCYGWDPITRDMLCPPVSSRTGAPPSKQPNNGKRKESMTEPVSKRKKTMEEPHVAARADACSNPESPNVAALANACSSPEAFRRLRLLVGSWRDRTVQLMQVDHSKNIAAQLVKIIDHTEAHTNLSRFICRFAKGKLAQEATEAHTTDYKRVSSEVIDGLLEALQWAKTGPNRRKLHNHLRLGRAWNRLCGDDGLLCLVPIVTPGSRSAFCASEYEQLVKSDDAVKRFQDSVSATSFGRALVHMAGIFQEAVWLGRDLPLFRWEDWDGQRLDNMSRKKLEPLLEIYPMLTANRYDPNTANWHKPDFWPWDWPANPTMVPADDVQCQLCRESECGCISSVLPGRIPHFSSVDGRGQGVRAIGSEGEIVYKKEQILGELLGELVPLDTYHDGWAMEFVRPDFNDEPIAQIYTKHMGNWVRKVNHSCRPSAEFRIMKISGSWRQMLVAIDNIPHNGEITAYCGRDFLRGRGIRCQCGHCG